MNNQLIIKRNIIQTRLILVFAVGFSLAIFTSCGAPKNPKKADIADINHTQKIQQDSFLKTVFKFAEPYFNIHSIDSFIALKGKPQFLYKEQWGLSQDSLLTIGYPLLTFNFLKIANSNKGDLESIYLHDKNTIVAGNLTIGKTTSEEIIQTLGYPDSGENEIEKAVTKSGIGDTVNFSYSINIDEYAIGFAFTNDTLGKIIWLKNMN